MLYEQRKQLTKTNCKPGVKVLCWRRSFDGNSPTMGVEGETYTVSDVRVKAYGYHLDGSVSKYLEIKIVGSDQWLNASRFQIA
jgi:hypothetical protein